SVGGGYVRDCDVKQRQQSTQAHHRQTDGPLCLSERPDRRHHAGTASMRGR
ncbi:Uncharacterized protein DAT39_004725, partial [Clarias magur]